MNDRIWYILSRATQVLISSIYKKKNLIKSRTRKCKEKHHLLHTIMIPSSVCLSSPEVHVMVPSQLLLAGEMRKSLTWWWILLNQGIGIAIYGHHVWKHSNDNHKYTQDLVLLCCYAIGISGAWKDSNYISNWLTLYIQGMRSIQGWERRSMAKVNWQVHMILVDLEILTVKIFEHRIISELTWSSAVPTEAKPQLQYQKLLSLV